MISRSLTTCVLLMLSLASAIAPVPATAASHPILTTPSESNLHHRQLANRGAAPLLLSPQFQTRYFANRATNRPKRGSWLKELNLSREQLQKIKDIRTQYQGKLTQQRQAAQRAQQELSELMSGNASAEQIRQKFNQVKTLKQQLADIRMESMLAIRNVLTPEQRQKLAGMMRQQGRAQRERMFDRMGEDF